MASSTDTASETEEGKENVSKKKTSKELSRPNKNAAGSGEDLPAKNSSTETASSSSETEFEICEKECRKRARRFIRKELAKAEKKENQVTSENLNSKSCDDVPKYSNQTTPTKEYATSKRGPSKKKTNVGKISVELIDVRKGKGSKGLVGQHSLGRALRKPDEDTRIARLKKCLSIVGR
jgi:hypothetical protein